MIRFIAVLVISMGIVSFWYNPGFIFWFLKSEVYGEIKLMISKLIPISLFTVPVILISGYLLFDRKPNLQPLFLATFYTLAFVMITTVAGGFFPSSPSRYIPELGISVAFLLSYLFVSSTDRIRKSNKFGIIRKFNLKIEYSLLVSLYLVTLVLMIVMENRIYISVTSVLGMWTQTGKTEIWHSSQNAGRLDTYVGYAITTMSIITLICLTYVYQKKEKY